MLRKQEKDWTAIKMKIEFAYSPIYDSLLTEMSRKIFDINQAKEMELYKEEIEAFWEKDENKIIKEIETIANLKFKSSKTCFIVKHMKYAAISKPLTIKSGQHLQRAKTILIHEIIHTLLDDNKEKIDELIKKIYPYETLEFKIHVPVLLITRKVVEKMYGVEIFNEIINDEMRRDILDRVWPKVNSIYPKFNKDIIKFLKNEKLY